MKMMSTKACHERRPELALAGHTAPSVVRANIEGLKAAEQASIIAAISMRYSNELSKGAAITVDRRQTRVRELPLT